MSEEDNKVYTEKKLSQMRAILAAGEGKMVELRDQQKLLQNMEETTIETMLAVVRDLTKDDDKACELLTPLVKIASDLVTACQRVASHIGELQSATHTSELFMQFAEACEQYRPGLITRIPGAVPPEDEE